MSALSHTLNPALQRLGEVSVRLSVELGRTDMALKDVLALAEGSVVSLDKLTDELLDITANGQVIAHGEVIAQDGKFALRIVSLAGGDEPMRTPPRTTPSGPKPDMPSNAPTAPYVSPSNAPRADAGVAEVSAPAAPTPAAPTAAAPIPEASAPADTVPNAPAPAEQSTPEQAPSELAAEEPVEAKEAAEPEVDPLIDALDELTDDLGEAEVDDGI